MYKRDITRILERRLREPVRFMQIITGPRQVGKTTAIRQVLTVLEQERRKTHYGAADLPAPPETVWIVQQWEEARRLTADGGPAVLVLDEVQKIYRWSEVVKKLWDEDRMAEREIHVVILGSSALLVQKGLSESLAGRFELLRCYHWTYEECRECFRWSLDQYLYYGGYPGGAWLAGEDDRWAAYVRDSILETAISRDILLLHPIEKPALLRQLFVLACEYAGQVLSYQKMLTQLTDVGNTVTLAHYQRLLESAYLVAGITKFSGSKIRIRSSSPKWLPLNTALVTCLSKESFEVTRTDAERWGRLHECAVGAHLFGSAERHGLKLFYWREGNQEVDFILQKGKQLVAIEVKSSRRRRSVSGVAAFREKYQPIRSIIVGPSGIPFDEFLRMNVFTLFE